MSSLGILYQSTFTDVLLKSTDEKSPTVKNVLSFDLSIKRSRPLYQLEGV